MTPRELQVARELATDTKVHELMGLAIQAHALFDSYSFEIYSDVVREMARVYGRELFPDEEEN